MNLSLRLEFLLLRSRWDRHSLREDLGRRSLFLLEFRRGCGISGVHTRCGAEGLESKVVVVVVVVDGQHRVLCPVSKEPLREQKEHHRHGDQNRDPEESILQHGGALDPRVLLTEVELRDLYLLHLHVEFVGIVGIPCYLFLLPSLSILPRYPLFSLFTLRVYSSVCVKRVRGYSLFRKYFFLMNAVTVWIFFLFISARFRHLDYIGLSFVDGLCQSRRSFPSFSSTTCENPLKSNSRFNTTSRWG